jgi:hypothetical protein
MNTQPDQWLPTDDPYIAAILRAAPPLTDEAVNEVVSIIQADRS